MRRLETMKELFKYQKVEQILGAIDKYSGNLRPVWPLGADAGAA